MGALKTGVSWVYVCVSLSNVFGKQREGESFYLYCQGIITQHTLEYPV